jgi:tetratricopeptide (TPR) repeat protein
MKNIFFAALLLAMSPTINPQQGPAKQEILYGKIERADLQKPPFSEWFDPGYNNYQADSVLSSKIKRLVTNDLSMEIFLGTWCGDSRREVPRLLRLLDDIGFPQSHLQIIALGGADSLLKQSPQHEEAGKGIFRVPTIIVYKNNIEINRINEFPTMSLEADLFAILSRQLYTPNYKTFFAIKNWMENGVLLNKNISARSLAGQLKALADGENELNSLAHLLLKQGRSEEALKIFQANYYLYPESARVLASLGEGYFKTGDQKNAVLNLERALETNRDPTLLKEILSILYAARDQK